MVNKAWDMKSLKQTARRNIIVLSLIGVWFVLATMVFTWFGIQAKTYQKEWQVYTVQVGEVFKVAASSEHTNQSLIMLADDLGAIKPPVVPQLLSISIGADVARAKQFQVEKQLSALQTNLHTTAAFIDYQQKAADELRALSLAAAANESQIQALAQKWQQAIDAIKNLAPPEMLANTHITLIQDLQEAQHVIASLAGTHANDDETGFKTRYEHLQGVSTKLRAQGAEITSLAATLDAERATLIALVKQNL